MKNLLLGLIFGVVVSTSVAFAVSKTLVLNPGDSAVISCVNGTPTPSPAPTPPPTPSPAPSPTTQATMKVYVSGYSFFDNTPPGSADISHPVIHSKAGGTGTFSDPVTVAVGHVINGGKDTLDFPAGTKFYIPNLRKYFIVEDSCGDGNTPQIGPCHKGYPSPATAWLDVYVGKGASKASSDKCMNNITGVHTAIMNPALGYAVVAGEIASNCAEYGETVIPQ